MKWIEAAGVLAVLAILLGLPFLLEYWRAVLLVRHYPPKTKLITLTAVAKGGIWTQEQVVGFNYWWKKPTPAREISLDEGDHVVVRLRSVDVLHSFAIPLLRIGPVEVPAGHTMEISFDADRPGVLTFLCWQVCSPDHQNLRGRFIVKSNGKEEAW